MQSNEKWVVAGRAALLILAMCVLPACDAVAPGADLSDAVATGAGTIGNPNHPTAQAREDADAALFRTRGASSFDLAFLPPRVRPGSALTATLLGEAGAPIMALSSRPGPGGHALSLAFGTMPPSETMIEARLNGRVVASAEAVRASNRAGGATSFQEPTSVHYYWYEGRDGQTVMGVEYDYDLHGGTTVSLVGTTAPVRADRIRFVVTGSQPMEPPDAVRIGGFDRLTVVE